MKQAIFLSLLLTLAACATKQPTMQTGPDAEVSFDGLVRVDNAVFDQTWASPDIDLGGYTKLLTQRAEFEFRAVRTTGTERTRSSQHEFPISESNRERLTDVVSEVFQEELAKSSRFELTDQPGPDVLVARGTLIDIVSFVPPERAGRSQTYVARVGEATLVVELVDAQSNEVLLRAIERRAAERVGGTITYSNAASNWAEIRRLARRWATSMRDGLDALEPPA